MQDGKIYTKEDFIRLFEVSPECYSKLCTYHDLLVKWQRAINLVSPSTLPQAWHRHFIDSAQITAFLPQDAKIYADLGCGGGFPGLVVAMMRPDLTVHLVESDERKGQFMRTVSRETNLRNVIIHTRRIEDITPAIQPDFITARALASLDKLLDMVWPWAEQNPDLTLTFMKGERAQEELNAAAARYDFALEQRPSITDDRACILRITALKRR